MAAPFLETVVPNPSTTASASTSHIVYFDTTLGGTEEGQLLIISFVFQGPVASTSMPAGWVLGYEQAIGTVVTPRTLQVWSKIAGASEGDSVTITTGTSIQSCAIFCRWSSAQITSVSAFATGTSAAPNSAEPSPPLALIGDTLGQYCIAGWRGEIGLSSYPASYGSSGHRTTLVGSGTSAIRVATGYRGVLSSTEDPGAFTLDGSANWAAITLAIEYSEGGEPPPVVPTDTSATFVLGSTSTSSPSIITAGTSGATILDCCSEATETVFIFGSLTWDATPERTSDANFPLRADGLSRYYPMALEERTYQEALDADDTVTVRRLIATSRNLTQAYNDPFFLTDAEAVGELYLGPIDKMCEKADWFKGQRYYTIPLDPLRSPSVEDEEGEDIEQLQWAWDSSWTMTMCYKWTRTSREQSIVALDPVFRLGISWTGDLATSLLLEDGEWLEQWSTLPLVDGEWAHIALVYDPDVGFDVYKDGVLVVRVKLTKTHKAAQQVLLGGWHDASPASGYMQDVRLYDTRKAPDFLEAESRSFCANWVEVL